MRQTLLDQRCPEWGTLAISILALTQPWLLALWRRYIRRGKVRAYESGNIELGFGNFGPSIGLIGTLRAVHQDVFVERISARVTRLKDNAQLPLTWRAFRPSQIPLGDSSNTTLEPAGSFLLSAASPLKYNIFFGSDQFVADYSAKASITPNRWHEFVEQRIKELEPNQQEQARAVKNDPALNEILWRDFSNGEHISTLYREFTTGFYWRAGRYKLEMLVDTEEPALSATKQWEFDLSEDDAELLRVNIIPLLRSLAGLTATYSFAYPRYESANAVA